MDQMSPVHQNIDFWKNKNLGKSTAMQSNTERCNSKTCKEEKCDEERCKKERYNAEKIQHKERYNTKKMKHRSASLTLGSVPTSKGHHFVKLNKSSQEIRLSYHVQTVNNYSLYALLVNIVMSALFNPICAPAPTLQWSHYESGLTMRVVSL